MLFSRRIAKRVRELREARRWSRERLAQELAKTGQDTLGHNGIYRIEQYPNPERRLTVDELAALAIVFDTTPHGLMGWDELVDGIAGWNGPGHRATVEELQQFDEDEAPEALNSGELLMRVAKLTKELERYVPVLRERAHELFDLSDDLRADAERRRILLDPDGSARREGSGDA